MGPGATALQQPRGVTSGLRTDTLPGMNRLVSALFALLLVACTGTISSNDEGPPVVPTTPDTGRPSSPPEPPEPGKPAAPAAPSPPGLDSGPVEPPASLPAVTCA